MTRIRAFPVVTLGLLLIAISFYNNEKAQKTALLGTTVSVSSLSSTAHSFQLAPGELPGYTGWARPEYTLAGRFQIVDKSTFTATAGNDWYITLQCLDCSAMIDPASSSWFYVRAYGPAILSGVVKPLGNGRYLIGIRPLDPGLYTVEVVLSFSAVPPTDSFPLPHGEQAPFYEGYLLPEFPLQLKVSGESPTLPSQLPYCTTKDLSETDVSAVEQIGRWRVVDSVRDADHQQRTPKDSVQFWAYQQSVNSLGVRLRYERTDCRIMPAPSAHHNLFQDCLAQHPSRKLHFILIGDSTMRLQKDVLESWLGPQIASGLAKVTFHELYGGILRCERVSGPRSTDISSGPFEEHEQRSVLFNTGLHDIHRLCGKEWEEDRHSYLTEEELQASCTSLYKAALRALVASVRRIPADIYLFQTTTAAWPKYGNFGVAWDPSRGQALPLDVGFISRFNQIAAEYLKTNYSNSIQIVDGYRITLPRPDNREIDRKAHIGKKLSHPGMEVTQTMVRIWSNVVLQTVCSSIFD